MFNQEEEDFLKVFVAAELSKAQAEINRIQKNTVIQEAIIARDLAFASIKVSKEAEILIEIQPFEDAIIAAEKG